MLTGLAQVLPDEAAALGASLRGLTAAGETSGVRVDAIDRQCRDVLNRLAAAPEREAGPHKLRVSGPTDLDAGQKTSPPARRARPPRH